MIKKTTYSRAFEACAAFFTETGQMPTIEAIKPRIGVNSPSTISSAIKDWKATLSDTIKTDQGALPGLPAALLDAVNGLWQQALAEAQQLFTDKVDALQAQQVALDAQAADVQAEAERLQPLLQQAEQTYQHDLAHLKQDYERVSAETGRLTEQAERYRSIATEADKDNAVLTETVRQQHAQVQRLTALYDQEHDWALRRIEEEKDSLRQQTRQDMTRLQAQTTRRQQEIELLQAKVDRLVSQLEAYRQQLSGQERQLVEDRIKTAELTLHAAHLQTALNEKEDRSRKLLAPPPKKSKSTRR